MSEILVVPLAANPEIERQIYENTSRPYRLLGGLYWETSTSEADPPQLAEAIRKVLVGTLNEREKELGFGTLIATIQREDDLSSLVGVAVPIYSGIDFSKQPKALRRIARRANVSLTALGADYILSQNLPASIEELIASRRTSQG